MKKVLIATLCLALSLSAFSAVRLPGIFSDGMVLQQNSSAALWGKATPGAKVTIKTGWDGAKTVATAGADSLWEARVATPSAGGPYSIRITDGGEKNKDLRSITLEDVLIGEVWFCSGQSNMEMPMKGFTAQRVKGAAEAILNAKESRPIRMVILPTSPSNESVWDCEGRWMKNNPQNVAETNATAYLFADCLQSVLDIPVGVVIGSLGGTKIERWMEGGDLYNGILSPGIRYTFKGMVWYQGESNIGNSNEYAGLQQQFVKQMRTVNGSDFPFLYVQIAPYEYGSSQDIDAALLMEAQQKASELEGCWMATTLDIGDEHCVHPSAKREVAQRLTYIALDKVYGYKGIDSEAPKPEEIVFQDGKAYVKFKVGDRGIGPLGQNLSGFELAGEDKVFHPANAFVETDKAKERKRIIVSSPEVPDPVAVRYCFRNYAPASLYNGFGIPAGPFRSDNW